MRIPPLPAVMTLCLGLAWACAPGPLERQDPASLKAPARSEGEEALPLARIAPGKGALVMRLSLPRGWRLHPRAPYHYRIAELRGPLAFPSATRKGDPVKPRFPIRIPFEAPPGRTEAILSVIFHACRGNDPSSCRGQVRTLRVSVEAAEGEKATEVPVLVRLDQ